MVVVVTPKPPTKKTQDDFDAIYGVVMEAFKNDRTAEDIRTALDFMDRAQNRIHLHKMEREKRIWEVVFLILGILFGSGATNVAHWVSNASDAVVQTVEAVTPKR